jgi:hypothetical protein
LISKIINMVERMKDATDKRLEVLFRSDAIADAGFSDRVVRRIRRRVWIRRWTMPIAVAVGGLIAVKPAVQLLSLWPALLALVPENIKSAPMEMLPQLSTVLTGVALAGAMVLFVRILEE